MTEASEKCQNVVVMKSHKPKQMIQLDAGDASTLAALGYLVRSGASAEIQKRLINEISGQAAKRIASVVAGEGQSAKPLEREIATSITSWAKNP